jgi:glycolate oxidase FAD binding subunit
MNAQHDMAEALAEKVQKTAAARTRLAITGNGTKRFYTGEIPGEPLNVAGHCGIVNHEPTELVITARGGTLLRDIEPALAQHGQMLAFEPPYFGERATLGGTLACGFSGPRRPYAGSARDFVLGMKIINGSGEILNFGGRVMKNVAGYDVSRFMVGSHGALGIILEASLKVLPKPAQEITLTFDMPVGKAIATMNAWAGQPLPLSACAHAGETLYLRLAGADTAIAAARKKLGGEFLENGATFWHELKEHQRAFFQTPEPLWRLSVPPAAPMLDVPGKWLIDWGGAQRWLVTRADTANVRAAAAAIGGYAREFRATRNRPALETNSSVRELRARIKTAFDEKAIFGVTNDSSSIV